MADGNKLYVSAFNPLLLKPTRSLPAKIAVIGAGTIGPDIAYYLKSALPGITLFLVDVVEKPLEKAEKRLTGYVQKALDRKRMKPEQAEAVCENIVYTTDYNRIKDCDLIIEAATENIPLKQKIFEAVESLVRNDAIIVSNTSSIPADRIFAKMKHPERTTIIHFFAPAWRSLPVEVITWEKSSQDVVDEMFWFLAHTGKVPIMTESAICFVLNRIFGNWCNDAAYLLEHATARQIDCVAEEFVSAGPFFVLNMTNGNPIIMETNTLQMEEGEHYSPAPILASVDRWNIGRPGSKADVSGKLSTIRDRMLGIFFSQSFDIIDRGIGTKEDLNLGCQIGLGFRKGPFDVMRDLGEAEVDRIMKKFQEERPGFPQAKGSFSDYQDFNRFVLVDEIDGVKVITIRRPQAMNALNDEITGEILNVLKKYSDDPHVKGFVITGYGTRAFCAGADIGRFPEILGKKAETISYTRECAQVQLFMDSMEKPVVAAVNGLALGGGMEIAIRCHSIVATKNALFQLPEISLGILPGLGGCVIPYRKWPEGATLFNEMICLGRPLQVREAVEIGMVKGVANGYFDLIQMAVDEVKSLVGSIQMVSGGKVNIPVFEVPDQPMAGKRALSKEAVAIAARVVADAASADTVADALEINYKGFGEIACTEAAKEGISAFLQKRPPKFKK